MLKAQNSIKKFWLSRYTIGGLAGTLQSTGRWVLAPCNDQSAGKKKSTKISRAGCYIKPVLVQCALAAINNKSFPFYRSRYEALKHRRGHKKAIVAIARMLLSVVFTLLQRGELFNPAICEAALKKPAFVLSPQQQLEHLASKLGYEIVNVPEPA